MKAITLRNLPPELSRRVRRRAADRRISLNRAVIDILEESLRGARPGKLTVPYDDLDFLIGAWSRKEAADFDRALVEQRGIDPELWK